MKILWIVNTIFPEVSLEMGLPVPNVGGWMYALAKDITSTSNTELAIATIYNGDSLKVLDIKSNRYYLIPQNGISPFKYNVEMEGYWNQVIKEYSPDLIHIHGTEYPHSLALLNSVDNKENIVVSIQGLVSVCERYYYAGIDFIDIIKNITFRDIIKFNTIIGQRKNFVKRGKFEKDIIALVPNSIGRTEWDYVHVKAINPESNYYFCNESLRDSFYNEIWDIKNIQRNSIFLSQAGYPIKGLHIVLKACSILKKKYPDLTINIGGSNIIGNNNVKDKLKRSGYSKYLNKLVKQYDLKENINWLGQLDEKEMAKTMARHHIFVCPSSIENSSNSLGEAQLIGTPCVASFVGGTPDMVNDGVDGLIYRYEEYEMLAYKVSKIFEDDILAQKLSYNGRISSNKRHDRINNSKELVNIYNKIISK